MDIVLHPSAEVLERAKKKDYERSGDFIINVARTCGIVQGKEPFASLYVGTVIFKTSKIRKSCYYRIGDWTSTFSGSLIKEALSLLKARRVRVHIHFDSSGYGPILLGTSKATVAIAPMFKDFPSSFSIVPKDIFPMESIIKKLSNRFKRGLVFAFAI